MMKFKTQKGITLIALVITIIVMLLLVTVSVTVALNGGLFRTAKQANDKTEIEKKAEQKLADGKIKVNGQWYASINDYLNNSPMPTGIVLDKKTINLKKRESEQVTGTEEIIATLKADLNEMEVEPEITWEVSPQGQTAIKLSAETGKEITITAVGAKDETVTVTAKCTYEETEYTATATVTLKILKPTVARGDFVEYGVAYKDVYAPNYEYTTTNGWRLLDYNYNADTGIYSNVKLISTGVPAGTYNYYIQAVNNDWWVEEETVQDPNAPSLSKFREVLGGEYYTFYTGDDTYYALQATAGTYYNLGEIDFTQGSWSSYNIGYFNSISIYGQAQDEPTIYDEDTNSTETKKGNELFKVREDATIRLITLPEINRILKRTTGADDAVDSLTQINATEDAIGLFRLNQLKNVTRMNSYDYSEVYYWLASPAPSTDARDNICYVRADGTIGSYYYDYGNSSGVRPVICISSNIQFTDSDSDGTLEMVVAQ